MRFFIISIMLCALVFPVFAQEQIPLIPFEDEVYTIQGLVPADWPKASPGLYVNPDNPQILVALQTAPLGPDALLEAILPQLGLTEAPEALSNLSTESLSWTLYEVEVPSLGLRVALGLADGDSRSYLVLLQAPEADYPALYEGVFLPLVEALAPLSFETEYLSEDISFPNGDISLAGTISLPSAEGRFPALVLISGSGKQDRDESLLPIAEIKPFRLLADYLTNQGYVVLRFDDRGVGGSTGDPDSTLQENASDVAAAIEYLLTRPEVNPAQIGLLGHSEGGTISALLGAENPNVAFIISMAGTSVNGADLLYVQNERLLRAEGATEEQISAQIAFLDAFFAALNADDSAGIKSALEAQIRNSLQDLTAEELESLGDPENYVTTQAEIFLQQYNSAWFRSLIAYDPAEDWAKVTVPVLALFGELDVQVDAEQNRAALELALANNPDYTIITLAGANHLFQAAETGALSEYGTLEQNFTPEFLPLIGEWLAERFGEQ